MVNADLAMFQAYNDIITKLEFQIEDSMEVQDPVSYSIINSVHLHAVAFGIFGGRCVTRVLFSKNVFVPEICFSRFAVTDYMCLIQDAFPGIFF